MFDDGIPYSETGFLGGRRRRRRCFSAEQGSSFGGRRSTPATIPVFTVGSSQSRVYSRKTGEKLQN